jgi:hypothetical protein
MMLSAGVAELVDALDLGSSDESRGGSSPSARTTRPHHLESVSSERGPGRGRRGACYAARMSHSGRAMLPDFAMLQMVDLGLPLSYQRRFRRFASVKLSVPRDLMKRGLPSSNLRSGFRTLTTTCHVVLHSRRRRLQGRADQIDNVPAFRPDQAGRRLTPCR